MSSFQSTSIEVNSTQSTYTTPLLNKRAGVPGEMLQYLWVSCHAPAPATRIPRQCDCAVSRPDGPLPARCGGRHTQTDGSLQELEKTSILMLRIWDLTMFF